MHVINTGGKFARDTILEVVSANKSDGSIEVREILGTGRLGAELHTFRDGEHMLL
jgi:hypothetical protein